MSYLNRPLGVILAFLGLETFLQFIKICEILYFAPWLASTEKRPLGIANFCYSANAAPKGQFLVGRPHLQAPIWVSRAI
jgi:hypothetical protein